MGQIKCYTCQGQGRTYFNEYRTCTTCGGTGMMWVADKVNKGSAPQGGCMLILLALASDSIFFLF